MSQIERHGHIIGRLVGCVTEHHTLVSGSLLVLIGTAHTAVYVVALLMDGRKDTA